MVSVFGNRANLDVLLVEDNDGDSVLIYRYLLESVQEASSALSVDRASTLSETISLLGGKDYDVVLLDLNLPDSQELEALIEVNLRARNQPAVVVISGLDDEQIAREALHQGAQDYLLKESLNRYIVERSISYSIERNKVMQELVSAREAALAAAAAKERFLANMSHEIRTPLTSIIGYGEMFLDLDIPREVHSRAGLAIVRNGRYLLELLDNVLDLAKLESGQIDLEHTPCSPVTILQEAFELMRLRAEEKGIDCSLEYKCPLPKEISSDPLKIKQILLNLLGNAVKFTERGAITVKISFVEKESLMLFEVIDTGIGMTPSQLTAIFAPFSQADPSVTRKYGGSGLGLVLSRRFAEALGGSIEVISNAGEGSAFTVTLPCKVQVDSGLYQDVSDIPATTFSKKVTTIPSLKGKVLVIDDAADIRALVGVLARQTGADVVTASGGQEGIDLGLREQFDLILMDMQMPNIDGISATSALRKEGITTPIVALTASVLANRRESFIEAGCTDYLRKPFRHEDLFEMLSLYLPQRSLNETTSPRQHSQKEPGIKDIMVAFQQKIDGKISELETAKMASDWDSLKHLAHRLCSAELFGIPHVTPLARELEDAASHRDSVKASELINTLRAVVKDFQRTHG